MSLVDSAAGVSSIDEKRTKGPSTKTPIEGPNWESANQGLRRDTFHTEICLYTMTVPVRSTRVTISREEGRGGIRKHYHN